MWDERAGGAGAGGRGGGARLAVALPTRMVDLADGIADSAAGSWAAGLWRVPPRPRCPGARSESWRGHKVTKSSTPTSFPKRLNLSILRCYIHGESKRKGDQPKGKRS